MNYLIKISIKTMLMLTVFLIAGCGDAFKYKKTNSKTTPVNVEERVAKNVEEGRGFRLGDLGKNSNTYDFASSNELWRASLTILDFMPLINADYSGGIIITDWYQEENNNSSVKITIRFLSNEIRVDGINVIIYKKNCAAYENCKVQKVESALPGEIKLAILKKATALQIEKGDENVKKRKKAKGRKKKN
jgi:hypothetical protein